MITMSLSAFRNIDPNGIRPQPQAMEPNNLVRRSKRNEVYITVPLPRNLRIFSFFTSKEDFALLTAKCCPKYTARYYFYLKVV